MMLVGKTLSQELNFLKSYKSTLWDQSSFNSLSLVKSKPWAAVWLPRGFVDLTQTDTKSLEVTLMCQWCGIVRFSWYTLCWLLLIVRYSLRWPDKEWQRWNKLCFIRQEQNVYQQRDTSGDISFSPRCDVSALPLPEQQLGLLRLLRQREFPKFVQSLHTFANKHWKERKTFFPRQVKQDKNFCL